MTTKMNDLIYTVTSGHIEHNNWRCWAWFATLEEAQNAVGNCGDFFFEHYYEHLIIEEIPRGAIAQKYNEWWYKWDLDNNQWRPIAKPEVLECVFHFGVG